MKKEKIFKIISPLIIIILMMSLLFSFNLSVSAEENEVIQEETLESGDFIPDEPEKTDDGGEQIANIFENIYSKVEENADKIFSALAFVATLVVGIFYKSGLLPLLKDALSKIKGSIDKAKEAEELHNKDTNDKIDAISETVSQMEKQINKIELGVEDYEKLVKERETMRLILSSQVDMLYAIFISSSLPEYQKEEIGLKIQRMREELIAYAQAE